MEEKLIKVTNRSRGTLAYSIPDTGIHRTFSYGETKTLPFKEIQQLQWVPGGDYMIKNSLLITDNEALNTLNMKVEPEYFYTEKEVIELLMNGSIEQLEDALNFAPSGVIEIIKTVAVRKEIPDTRKRDLILKKTGFNVQTAIDIQHTAEDMDKAPIEEAEETPVRKAAPIITEASAPVRKSAPIKVVKKSE